MGFGSYFRFSLWLPYLVGLPAAGLLFGTEIGAHSDTIFFVVFCSLFLGVPYTLYAVLAFWWSRSRADRTLKKTMWLAPLGFLPLLLVGPLLSDSSSSFAPALLSLAVLGWVILLYLYVLLTFFGWLLLKLLGLAHEQG